MNKVKGVIFAVISAVTFGFAPILISKTYVLGNNPMMMAFSRNLLMIPILFLYLLAKGVNFRITKKQFFQLVLLSGFGTTTSLVFLYNSYNYIPVSMATSINFVYPTLVAVASVLVFKESMSKFRKLAVVSSLIGIFLFMDISGGSKNLFIGVGLALTSGFAYAFYIIFLAKSGLLKLPSLVITFYSCIVCSVLIGIIGAFTKTIRPGDMALEGWLLTLVISILITILGAMFIQLAVLNVGTTVTSVLATLEPITTLVLGYLLFQERVGFTKLMGCILVLTAVLLLALDQRRMSKERAKNIEVYEDIVNEEII